MRACPRRFAFQYVEQAPKDFLPASPLFGGSIHAALELYFRARLEGLGVTQEALLSAYHDSWRRQKEKEAGGGVPVRFNKGETFDLLFGLADRMLRAFLRSPPAHPDGTILGAEEELRVVLDGGLPDVLAKVDLVTEAGGALHVTDFKTSRSRWGTRRAEESAGQLLLYGSAVAGLSERPSAPVRLRFAVLTKAKRPAVQVIEVPGGEGQVQSMTREMAEVWSAIRAGEFHPSPSPQTCTACPFRSRCPVFAGRGS